MVLTKTQEALRNLFEDELELGDETKCERIVQENFPSGLKEFKLMDEAELTSMVSDYERMRDATDLIRFRLTGTRRLKGLMHYVQDLIRTDEPIVPSIISLDDIVKAIERNRARQASITQSSTNVASAIPPKLVKEKEWTTWIASFTHFLRVIPGSTGIPLAYVIRENDNRLPENEYSTFLN